jgi:hypothetical protein
VLQAKDGEPRQTSRQAEGRPRYIRAAAVSLAIVAGISTIVAACGLARFPRRKSRIPVEPTAAGIPLQQLTRYRSPDGTHSIHGTLLAEFEPGERSTTIHAAFCPPFEVLPEVEVEVTDDSFATVKLTQLLHNGVEIDVRLPQPATGAQHVTIEMMAAEGSISDS